MKFYVGSDRYEFSYFPFFRMKTKDHYHIYGMRLPSNHIEEIFVFDLENPLSALREYSAFLVEHIVLEDDDALTARAQKVKQDVIDLLTDETKDMLGNNGT